MADAIRAALERAAMEFESLGFALQVKGYEQCANSAINEAHAARAALAAEPPAPAEPDTDAVLALAAIIRQVDGSHSLGAAALAEAILSHPGVAFSVLPPAPAPREALAARPLLEAVARLGDCIGQHTVGEIATISDRAAAWLRENPPGQPVAIEPRGCPTPGACSCVEPPAPAPAADSEREELAQWLEGEARSCAAQFHDRITRAAALLRQPAPAPVPVADGASSPTPEEIALLWDASNSPSVFAGLVLARWGSQPPAPAPAADGERDHVPGAGNMVPAAYAARLRQCPTHGQLPANAWGCPECLRELREELAKLKTPAAGAEEREAYAQWLDGRGAMADLGVRNSYFRAAALLRQQPPEGLSVEEYYVENYYHVDSGARIVRELCDEEPGWCWMVRNSRHVSPCTEFRTVADAVAALRQTRRQEVGDA